MAKIIPFPTARRDRFPKGCASPEAFFMLVSVMAQNFGVDGARRVISRWCDDGEISIGLWECAWERLENYDSGKRGA